MRAFNLKPRLYLSWIISVAFASAAVAANEILPDNPSLPPWTWEASKPGGAPVWLVGVLHLGTKSDETCFPAYLEVYHHASSVYLELFPGSAASFDEGSLLGKLGVSKDRIPLRIKIPPETWREMKTVFSSRPDELLSLDTVQPWYAALLVTDKTYADAGLAVRYSLEQLILAQASVDRKPVGDLETPVQEISALADAPSASQVKMLDAALNQPASLPMALDDAWRAGRADTLIALLATAKSVDLQEIDTRVIEQRNMRWLKEIDHLSSQGRQTLVLVGVEHLLDPEFGLLRLLKENGFTLNPEPPGI